MVRGLSSVSNRWEVCNLTNKVAIRLQRGAPIQLPSAAKLILFLKNCTPPIDLAHFKHKIIANDDGGDGGNGDDDARRIKSLRAPEKFSQGAPIQPCPASPVLHCCRVFQFAGCFGDVRLCNFQPPALVLHCCRVL